MALWDDEVGGCRTTNSYRRSWCPGDCHRRQKTWSTGKLFILTVIDLMDICLSPLLWSGAKLSNNWWVAWSRWCNWHSSELNNPEVEAVFIKSSIKKSLQGQHRLDSIVNVEVPVPNDSLTTFAALGKRVNNLLGLESVSAFDTDFTFVMPGTIA